MFIVKFSRKHIIPGTVMEDTKLTIKIENKNPVELIDFTKSFLALGNEYRHYIATNRDGIIDGEVKLFIKEIKPGSIIADLIALSPMALPLMETTLTIVGFSGYLKKCYDYLLGHKDENPRLVRNSLQNFSEIVSPVAKDNGSQIIISTIVKGDVHNHFHISSLEANAIQNATARETELLKEPTTGLHQKVLLYWYQAKNDAKSQTGDKAIVETISAAPVKTIFAQDSIKAKILLEADDNPFKAVYIVDVAVETINGIPKLYKITTLHEKIPKEEL